MDKRTNQKGFSVILIFLLLLICLGIQQAGARDVPFSDGNAVVVHSSFYGAYSVYTGDIDGDGDLDVLGAAFEYDDIGWFENTAGDGTAWTEHIIDGDFDGAFTVRAADVDGDGDLDALGAAQYADEISWFENTVGDGTAWTKHIVDSNFGYTISVYATDIDGDGDVDVLGASLLDDDIAWWENTAGDGTAWTEHTVEGEFDDAVWVYAADVDGDGDVDVLGAALNSDQIAWFENTSGDGTAWTKHTIDDDFEWARCVYAADVDGDGDLDVLGTASQDNEITWWENTASDGTAWTKHTIDNDFYFAISVYAVDIDRDGDIDVLGAANWAEKITWWENTAGDGTAWTEHNIGVDLEWPESIHAADVDGDGDLDVLGAITNGGIQWWENQSRHYPVFFPKEHTVDSDFIFARTVCGADIDDDGDLDTVGATAIVGEVAWWENTSGDGTGWTEYSIDNDFGYIWSIRAADIDGDGALDILGSADSNITWWENSSGDGTVWTEYVVDGNFDGARSVYAADIDDDGDLDVVGAAYWADEISWWENTAGDGTAWTEHIIDSNSIDPFSIYAADVDGDGDLDVLGAVFTTDDILWWENVSGDGTIWTEHVVDNDFNWASSVCAGDIDRDGDLDILGTATAAYEDVTWWENTDSNGTAWTEHTIEADFSSAPIYAVDVDGDGDLDVLGGNEWIVWWENSAGDGTAWVKHTEDGGSEGVVTVHPADVDGDSDLDVLKVGINSITWLESRWFIAGDLDYDEYVDFYDFAVLALAWLSDDTPTANWNPECDISEPNDGVIDELDLAVFVENWLAGE